MVTVRSACPLNCPDSCGFLVEQTENGLRLRGDHQNPITKGFVCTKAQRLAERVFSPDRLRFPLLKQEQGWKRISWEDAYKLITEKIEAVLNTAGSQGILHHFDYGHNGVLRSLDRRFFQAIGGVTEPRGSMCWGAGYRAQELDFGGVYSSDWEDLIAAKTIILWGRDPAVTNIHLIPYLLEAKKQGAEIIVINPVRVKSAQLAQTYICIRPGTDDVLALGLSYIILKERWLDLEFVQKYISGFEDYALKAAHFPPEKVEELTGINGKQLWELAYQIAHARPVSILLGYGLQRYRGGGYTVRAIDAIAAITGNIGCSGAGVHYTNQYHSGKFNTLLLPPERYQSRTYPHARLAEELQRSNPPVQLAFVTRSNPLVQQPNSILWREVWHSIPFKVVLETVMTETARQADLILPVTTIFEEEELIVTSWSPLIQYAQKVIEPQGEAKPEPVIFSELAARLGHSNDFSYTPEEWIKYAIAPLEPYGITIETLRQGALRAPYIPDVAWESKKFATPSGKIEIGSIDQAQDGEFIRRVSIRQKPEDSDEFPLHLVTPHPAKGLHSQFHDVEGFTMYIHPELASKRHLLPGNWAIVETAVGQLKAKVMVSEDIHPETVVIPEGTTVDGFGVNQLIATELSDLGENTPYYDTRCQIKKWFID